MQEMIEAWQEELADLKSSMIIRGGESGSLEYKIWSAEALRLSMCISDVLEVLAQDEDKKTKEG